MSTDVDVTRLEAAQHTVDDLLRERAFLLRSRARYAATETEARINESEADWYETIRTEFALVHRDELED